MQEQVKSALEFVPDKGSGKKRIDVEGAGWEAFKKKGWDGTKPEDIPDEEIKRICLEIGLIKEFKYVNEGGLWFRDGIAASILDRYDRSQEIFATRLDKLMATIDTVLKYLVLSQCHDTLKTIKKEEITQEDIYAHMVAVYGFYGLLEQIARLSHKTGAVRVFDIINSEGAFRDEYAEPLLKMLRDFREIEQRVGKALPEID